MTQPRHRAVFQQSNVGEKYREKKVDISVTNKNGSTWSEKLIDKSREEIACSVVNSAYEIIKCKGYTNLTIGVVISYLVGVIFSDGKTILPVSTMLKGEYGINGVVMSIPALVGSSGVEEIMDLPLNNIEMKMLYKSSEIIRRQFLTVEMMKV